MTIRTLIVLALVSIVFIPLSAQDQQKKPVDTIVGPKIQPYKITEVPAELEKLNESIAKTWKVVSDSLSVTAIDSIMPLAQKYLDSVKVIFDQQQGRYTYRSLENFSSEWSNYGKRLETWKNTISSRVKALNDEVVSLEEQYDRWEVTLNFLIEKESGDQIQNGIIEILDSIKIVSESVNAKVNYNLNLLNSISDKLLMVQDAKNTIREYQLEIQAGFFNRDNPAIWVKKESEKESESLIATVRAIFKDYTRVVNIFITNNLGVFYFHIFLSLFLLILFIVIRRRILKLNIISDDNEIVLAKKVLLNSWMVALFLSILFGVIIYENRPIFLTELIVLLLLAPLLILLSKIVSTQLQFYIRIIIILIIVDQLQIFLDPNTLFRRLILLLETSLAIWFFYEIFLFKKRHPELFVSKLWRLLAHASPVFIFILIISFLANIFGYVRLSSFLTNSFVSAIILTASFYVLLIILRSLSMYGLRLYNKEFWHNDLRISFQKRIGRILTVLVFFVWIVYLLRIFNVYELLLDWTESIMDIEWSFGEATISFGGIISFIFILIITFLLASWIKKLFKSESILRSKIPRGVPAAISMLTRYIIVAFGVYLALMAAGVDLGQFGLIAGALGVGIGFGLQNVVYNFISGLIISFERPIHVGDTIEVGTLMGNVTEIGVRSSKVKTFDGSEVIVPNGNLISNEVINWTLSDQKRRLKIIIRTDYNADPKLVLKIIKEETEKYPNTLKEPPVMALFDGYGDSSLDFTLYFWVYFNVSFTSKSEVALNIYEALKSEGIGVPLPMRRWQQDIGSNPSNS